MTTEVKRALVRVLTLSEAAAEARVSPRTLAREIAAGRLIATRVRGCVRILASDLDSYLHAQRTSCRSDAAAIAGRLASSTLGVDLSALFPPARTRSNSSAASARASKIIELEERRGSR